jgi:hypothetical protein
MKLSSKLFLMSMLLLLLASFALPNPHPQQNLKSLLANAHGKGTLTVGDEVYKVTNVVVKLDEDGTGEITLVTNLQLFVQCTWSAPADLSQGIDLKITGGISVGSAEGSGKLLLRQDGKEIASLSMGASGNARKRKIQLTFVAD